VTDEEADELRKKVDHMDKCLRLFLSINSIRQTSAFWPLMEEMGITPPMRPDADGNWVSTKEEP